MRILLVGSGAREHALAWSLSRFGHRIDAAPGNPGIARVATCHEVAAEDLDGLLALARRCGPDLVVVGPEAPLVLGLTDRLRKEGVPVFGPTRAAAALEGSKAFAKTILEESGVSTAAWAEFEDAAKAEDYAATLGRAVVKADGLAAGKGVIVAASADEARQAVRAIMRDRVAGGAGERVIVEEFLEGEEASAIALCDGTRFWMLPAAQDHKRLLDGDLGPNTGGMGAYSPTGALPDDRLEAIGRAVIAPVLATMARRETPFVGALYAGLMMTARGPKVLEFNCRFGDPETQPLMMRLEGDLGEALAACAAGRLGSAPLAVRPEAAVGVVLAAAGYPAAVRKGDAIHGLDGVEDSDTLAVFHAGTRRSGGQLITSGGRVLTVTALGPDVEKAREAAYRAADQIHFKGKQERRDIAARELARRQG